MFTLSVLLSTHVAYSSFAPNMNQVIGLKLFSNRRKLNVINSHSYTGQQPANLAVLFAARSTSLDRPQYIRAVFRSANITPRRVHLCHLHC